MTEATATAEAVTGKLLSARGIDVGGIRRSPEQDELIVALHSFQAVMGSVPEGSWNPFFSSTYADLATVKTFAQPHLSQFGLVVSQFPGTAPSGRPTLITTVMHISGQWMEAETVLMLSKNDIQGQGAAITYLRRYAFSAVLGIVSEEDPDGSAPAPAQAARPAAAAKPATGGLAGAVKAQGATKKAAARTPKEGVSEEKGSRTEAQGKAVWGKACSVVTGGDKSIKPDAADVRKVIRDALRDCFNGAVKDDRDLSEGEAEIFLTNLELQIPKAPVQEDDAPPPQDEDFIDEQDDF